MRIDRLEANLSGRLADVSPWLIPTSAAVAVLVVWKHRDNLKRLRLREEPRLGEKGSAG